jgi:hypothetical protein
MNSRNKKQWYELFSYNTAFNDDGHGSVMSRSTISKGPPGLETEQND